MRIWLAISLAVVLAGTVRFPSDRAGTGRSPVSSLSVGFPLDAGRPYVVTISGDSAEFTLPFQTGEQYLFVLSSLADPHREYPVNLVAVQTDRQPHLRGYRLPRDTDVASRQGAVAAPGPTTIPVANRDGPSASEFFLHVTDGRLDDRRHYARISTRQLARGTHVRVLADRRTVEDGRMRQRAAEIVRLFETEILPRSQSTIGAHIDVDGDGLLTVVLTPWLGHLQGGRTSLGGLVRPSDFRMGMPAPFSNRCDVLFLNSSLNSGPHLKAILAHEYAHVVTFSRRYGRADALGQAPDLEDWLSEGIAHVAEHLHGVGWSNLDHRIAAYLRSPQSYPLVISDYYAAGLWRNHGCRGATFLFLRWCTDRFGERFVRDLVQSRATGVDCVEEASGRRFEDVFRRWTIALAAESLGGTRGAGLSQAGFSSVRLHGKLGGENLSGPAVIEWNGESDLAMTLKGTSVAFVRLSSRTVGSRRIRIRSTPGARLQMTLIRISGP